MNFAKKERGLSSQEERMSCKSGGGKRQLRGEKKK